MSNNNVQQNPIAWVEIYVDDLQRAKKFYEAVFQVELSPLPSPKEGLELLVFPMEMGGTGSACALAKMQGVAAAPGSVLVYFSCSDCAEQISRVAAAGGEVVHDKFSIDDYGYIAIVKDSEGNMIGLHSAV